MNTELFIEYLNENYDKNYQLRPLLCIIDEILNDFYQSNYWGYSLPNYISAVHNAHPNYAGYLDDKKTLTVEDMNEIFEMMDDEKKISYDKAYIDELYLKHMSNGKVQEAHKEELSRVLRGRKILLVAPGKSSVVEAEQIQKFAREHDIVIISVNFEYSFVDVDYIFLSNLRRFRELDKGKRQKCIVTSNISASGVYFQTKYEDLVNPVEAVSDNAGLMAIRLLINYRVDEIVLAGFDGYSHDIEENYANGQTAFITRNAVLDAMNEGMNKILEEYSKQVKISFLTESKYVCIRREKE